MTKRRRSRAQSVAHNIGNEENGVSRNTASQVLGTISCDLSENETAVTQKPESVPRLTAAGNIAKGNGGRSRLVSERILNKIILIYKEHFQAGNIFSSSVLRDLIEEERRSELDPGISVTQADLYVYWIALCIMDSE